jgi:hypothetical protein
MLRSSERQPRRFSTRQGLVVTDVRCGSLELALVRCGATTVPGGDDSGVNAYGEEGVESCASSFWIAAGVS